MFPKRGAVAIDCGAPRCMGGCMRKIRFIRFLGACAIGGIFSLFVAILIVDADEAAAEGQYFAKGDEDGVMDLCQWRTAEARQQHRAPEGAERNCRCQLKIFHIHSIKFCRLRRGCVALRRLPLHSSLPPRAACITSPTATPYCSSYASHSCRKI